MKTLIKLVLVTVLFCGAAYAEDGDMGNGGLWAGPVVSSPTADGDGDMGNGGKTCPQGQTCLTAQSEDGAFSFFSIVRNLIAGV